MPLFFMALSVGAPWAVIALMEWQSVKVDLDKRHDRELQCNCLSERGGCHEDQGRDRLRKGR
jgi:hypothetical protein